MSSSTQPPTSLSVTKVRQAFECPRLMYLGHHEGGMTLFRASTSTYSGIGQTFHKLCSDCVDYLRSDAEIVGLLTPSATQLNPETLARQIQQQLYRAVFFPLVQETRNNNPKKIKGLMHLWEGLTGLIRRWAELLVSNRRVCSPKETLLKTFLKQEMMVSFEFGLPNGDRQTVRGKFDSLVYDFTQQRLCVVEYKTYQATDPAAQLVQVALYGYMLKQKLGVTINSAVYSVLPDWHGVEYSWDLLETTLHKLIPHKLQQIKTWLEWRSPHPSPPPMAADLSLCNVCPQKKKCQHYFETAADSAPPVQDPDPIVKDIPPLVVGSVAESFSIDTSKPVQVEVLQVDALQVKSLEVELPAQISTQKVSKPTMQKRAYTKLKLPNSSTDGLANNGPSPDAVAQQLIEVLQAFNVGVDYVGSALGPAFIRVKLKPHLGMKVSSILKYEDDIRVHLGLQNPPLMAPQAGYISVDLPRPDRQTAFFSEYFANPKQNEPKAMAAIGVNLDGQLVEADLSDPNTCHFLVGGTTGSGKSEFLRSLLLSLTVRHSPDHFKVALVDPKRVTFPEFETMRWLYEPIVKTKEDAISLMERLVTEMDGRYQRFENARCSNLSQYNQKATVPIPRILCIFDEYADFMADKSAAKELEHSIQRLGAMARAAGIHLIIATQRPEAKVVTPLIRSNLPGRVALRTASDADSAIILGGKQGAAANLLGKGDLFYDDGGELHRLQSLFAPPKTVENLIE